MSELKDIWNNGDPSSLSREELEAYLSGKLSQEEQHELERLLSENSLESDALEGLKSLGMDEARKSVSKVNKHLHQSLSEQRRKRKKSFSANYWNWIAVIIVMLLIVVGFLIIFLM